MTCKVGDIRLASVLAFPDYAGLGRWIAIACMLQACKPRPWPAAATRSLCRPPKHENESLHAREKYRHKKREGNEEGYEPEDEGRTDNREAHDESPHAGHRMALDGLPQPLRMLVVLAVEGIVHENIAGEDLGVEDVDIVIAVQTLLGLLRMGRSMAF